jgi:hypothetical protein
MIPISSRTNWPRPFPVTYPLAVRYLFRYGRAWIPRGRGSIRARPTASLAASPTSYIPILLGQPFRPVFPNQLVLCYLPLRQGLDPSRPWVDSSPSNGILSREPYIKRWGNPYDSHWGDVHHYDYYKDCELPDSFPE